MSRNSRRIRTAFAVLSLSLVVGCTALYRNHGYAPTDAELSEVLVGVDSRDSVTDIIGPPTAGSLSGDGNFYYVQSRFRHFAYQAPQEIEREVVAISFDAEGIVSNVERFGLEDGRIVALSRRVTDDGIRDTTFLSQLFGSLGNFDPGALLSP